jgi:AcrR family transcriptional regulator
MAGTDKTVQPQARAGRRSAQHRQRLERIVAIAAELFAERGYHATSVQELSEATGLQRGALYHYINGKLDLLYHVHAALMEPILQEARAIEQREEPAGETLRGIARLVLEAVASNRALFTVSEHEWQVLRDDPRWDEVRRVRREMVEVVERVLARGVDDGTVAARTDRHLATFAFFGVINSTYQWFDPDGPWSAREVADGLTEIFLVGVGDGDSEALG